MSNLLKLPMSTKFCIPLSLLILRYLVLGQESRSLMRLCIGSFRCFVSGFLLNLSRLGEIMHRSLLFYIKTFWFLYLEKVLG